MGRAMSVLRGDKSQVANHNKQVAPRRPASFLLLVYFR